MTVLSLLLFVFTSLESFAAPTNYSCVQAIEDLLKKQAEYPCPNTGGRVLYVGMTLTGRGDSRVEGVSYQGVFICEGGDIWLTNTRAKENAEACDIVDESGTLVRRIK